MFLYRFNPKESHNERKSAFLREIFLWVAPQNNVDW
jgi:hypothetical protein